MIFDLVQGKSVPLEKSVESNVIYRESCGCKKTAEDFETLNSGYNTAIVIYSIVNSLLELNYITMVRITINGSSTNTFNGMSLDDSFSKNLDIVEDISK